MYCPGALKNTRGQKIVGVRSDELTERLDALVAAHPGTLDKSKIVKAALEEYLPKLEAEAKQPGLLPIGREVLRTRLKKVALTSDPGKVSLWLGHQSPTMLHRHYRGLTTKAEAVKFFDLAPAK